MGAGHACSQLAAFEYGVKRYGDTHTSVVGFLLSMPKTLPLIFRDKLIDKQETTEATVSSESLPL